MQRSLRGRRAVWARVLHPRELRGAGSQQRSGGRDAGRVRRLGGACVRGCMVMPGREGSRPAGIAAAVLTSLARRSARLSAPRAWPLAPSIASRPNTDLGEDESGLSGSHAADSDEMLVRAAGVVLAVGGSLAALTRAAGPGRARSPRGELVRDFRIVGVAPRIMLLGRDTERLVRPARKATLQANGDGI